MRVLYLVEGKVHRVIENCDKLPSPNDIIVFDSQIQPMAYRVLGRVWTAGDDTIQITLGKPQPIQAKPPPIIEKQAIAS